MDVARLGNCHGRPVIPRNVALAVLTSAALVASTAGSVSQASPAHQPNRRQIDSVATKAPALPTTNRYAVKVIAKIAPDSGHIMVSSNGKWAVTDTKDTIGSTIQLVNVAAGKVVGTISSANDAPLQYAVGVDNAGIAYGTVILEDQANDSFDEGFLWNGKTNTRVPLPPGLASGCMQGSPSAPSVYFNSVNASGVAVGVGSWLCKQDNSFGYGAVLYSPQDGVEFTGSFHDSSDVLRHPAEAYEVDDAGIVSGYLYLPDTPEVEWRVGVDAAPQVIATNVGEPAVYPAQTNALWQNGDFVGSAVTDVTTAPQSLFHGNKDSETVTLIPDTSGDAIDGLSFVPQAMDPKELVVGDSSPIPNPNGVTGPAVWAAGSAVTELSSLLVSPTKDHLLSAMAVDDDGDIFGTATTSTAKNAPLYLYEAVVTLPAPTVKLTAPKGGKTYKKGVKLKASYTCKAGKGAKLKSCKGTEPDHHKVSTKKTGKHSFTVTATDTDGQKTKKTVHFTVKK
jgi:hypothetical protein